MLRANDWPRFLDAGDRGLVVEFGDTIDEALSRRVIALDTQISAAAIEGVQEAVPTYRSLLVLFEPTLLRKRALKARIEAMLADPLAAAGHASVRRWTIPVLYGGAHGEDLDEVASLHGLTTEEVIRIHSGAYYRVYMIGFMPGFAYLGGLPEAIHTSRRTTPRQKTPPRSVSIGGRQAAVSPPMAIPSAWQMLGQTPVRVYDPARADRPFLLGSGDRVRFEPVGSAEYARMTKAAEQGELVATIEEIAEASDSEPAASRVEGGGKMP
jgi:5-oxoprolinase (ATP-hydrolysing) subunit B